MTDSKGTPATALDTLWRQLATDSVPDLGPRTRPDRLGAAAVEQRVDDFARTQRLPASTRDGLRALALLWHDHLDAAHRLAQDLPTPDGSFLHGIMHRREPDYGNAAYWFRRVGAHRAYPLIAAGLSDLATKPVTRHWTSRLAPGQVWDPFAFIDACQEVAGQPPEAPVVRWLQEVQRLEFRSLLRCLLPEDDAREVATD